MSPAAKTGAIVNSRPLLGMVCRRAAAYGRESRRRPAHQRCRFGLELAYRGVRVNAIEPLDRNESKPATKSFLRRAGRRHPRRDSGRPSASASERDSTARSWMLARRWTFIAGTTIVVEGGQVVRMRG